MKIRPQNWLIGGAAIACAALVGPAASAQEARLIDLPMDQLRGAIQMRFDAALAATTDSSIVSATSDKFIWASEAKAHCGIALGYLKSNTRDPESIRRCSNAYDRMIAVPPPKVVPTPVVVKQDNCPEDIASTFYFDWNVAVPPADAAKTAAFVAENRVRCGWKAFTVVGHTDRSGTDRYNDDLAIRRAAAVKQVMIAAGIPANIIADSGKGERDNRVATPDGVRNDANRRVEVQVSEVGERP
jgi:outer membrane protein OmpA-like peptidoglycan-associated protein